jgi:ribonuclease HI
MARPQSPSPPEAPESVAVLWTDGAARGNPGPAGIGAILKSPNGEVLFTGSEYLGHTTNNVAEYKAVLLGLAGALAQGVTSVEVRADSELLIRQLKGEYRVKSEGLKPLFEEARRLLSRFKSVKLTHIRRELNGEADWLANQGIDKAEKG